MTSPDTTLGDSPILETTGPVVTIEGHDYPLRRLGIRDTFAVARIIAVGATATNQRLDDAAMTDPDKLSGLMLSGVIAAEKTAFDLLASLINVTPKELSDPNKFPMGSELSIIEALVEHQDIKAFFAHAGTLMKRLPEMRTRSRAQSTT